MEFEVARHVETLEGGARLAQETRGWDEERGRTVAQRSKEEANDYRYFPEPDLPPLRPSTTWVAELRAGLPELPAQRRARYTSQLGLSDYDARVLTADLALGDYFEGVLRQGIDPKPAANWVTGEFSRLLNERAAEGLRADRVALRPAGLAELIAEVAAGRVSGTNAKVALATAFASGESPRTIIERDGLGKVDTAVIDDAIASVLAEFAAQVEQYRSGQQQLLGFLIGKVVQRTGGRADARVVSEELSRRLDT
jgi:aspartyl-tRNA(Asn)/glutamyl-tRNA(Gln) amidotransferase subunit B